MTQYSLIGTTDTPFPQEVFEGRHWIDGAYRESANGEWFERFSPAHARLVSRSSKGSAVEAELAIKAARRAFDSGIWSQASGKERAKVLNKVADLLEQNFERMAVIEALESGKPITQARGEISGAADLWRYAAAQARTMKGDSHNTLGTDMLGVVLKEPIGVVSIITPWNFPFWILSQKLPFALAAGCTCVIKPSEMTPSTTAMLPELLMEAGLPNGVVNIVLGFGQPVGETITAHKDVDMISFTGSTMVGKAIAATAAGSLKKVALELGGKNPQVIFPDANLDEVADAVAFGVYFNQGECCNSGSRIIVHDDVMDPLIEKVVALSKQVKFGDPMHSQTQVGAIISRAHQDKIKAYVDEAVQNGAELCLGGGLLNIAGLEGQFFEPTILRNVRPDMPIACEEVFGPVLSVLSFNTMDEAVEIANNASYGLSAAIWSDDIHKCLEFARRAQAGTVWTNTWMDGYPELCFGGMKESGQGRENGGYGLEEFLEVKTVVMRIGRTRSPWVKTS